MTRLTPFFSRVAVVSKSFEGQTDKKEEWYGTQYKQEAISEETIKVNHCGHAALNKSHNTSSLAVQLVINT